MEPGNFQDTLEIRDVFKIIKKRVLLIIIITCMAALISGLISFYIIKPLYEARISIVIVKEQQDKNKLQYDYNDIMMYQNLVKTYAKIAQSRTVAQRTIMKLDLRSLTPEELQREISVTPLENTQIIDIRVRNPKPMLARDIVNTFSEIFIEESKRIYPLGNVQIIDEAVAPDKPVSPNKGFNIAIALIIGLILSTALSLILEYIDDTLKSEEEVSRYLGIPVVGIIPKIIE